MTFYRRRRSVNWNCGFTLRLDNTFLARGVILILYWWEVYCELRHFRVLYRIDLIEFSRTTSNTRNGQFRRNEKKGLRLLSKKPVIIRNNK